MISALVLVAASAGLSQAAPAAQPPQKTGPDAQIEHRIQMKFAKSKINAEHFTVSVHNGVATIQGKTNVFQHKGVATRLAKTGGAVAVQNHIQVSDEAKAKAAARLAKANGGANPGQPVARATVIQPGSK